MTLFCGVLCKGDEVSKALELLEAQAQSNDLEYLTYLSFFIKVGDLMKYALWS